MGTLIPTKRVNTYTEISFDPNGVIDSTIGDKAINLIDGSVYEHRGNKVWEKLSELPSDVNFTRSRKAKGFRYIDEALQFGGFLKDEIIEIASYHKDGLYGGGKFKVHSTPLQNDCCAYNNPISSESFTLGELTENDYMSITLYVPEQVNSVKGSLLLLDGTTNDQEIEIFYYSSYWTLKSGSGDLSVVSVKDSNGNEVYRGSGQDVFNYRDIYTVVVKPNLGNTQEITKITFSACVPISATYNFNNTVSGVVNFVQVGTGAVITSNNGLDFSPVGGDPELLWKPDVLTPNGFDVFSHNDTSIIRVIDNNVVTPQMFGAMTSPSKKQFGYDCSDAIQSAFDSRYSVYIPSGYYYITKNVILRRPKSVSCEGSYSDTYDTDTVPDKQVTSFISDRNIDFITFNSKDITWRNGVIDTSQVYKTEDGTEDTVGHTKTALKIDIDGGIWGIYCYNIGVFGSREKLLHSGIGTIGLKINCDEEIESVSQSYISHTFFSGGRIENCRIGVYNPPIAQVNNGYVTIATFYGSGLDDLISSGGSSGGSDINYIVEIDGVGSTDTFRWSLDNGSTWTNGVQITGDTQELVSGGASITFGATTGHTLGDLWKFTERTKRFIWGNNVFLDIPIRACKQYIIHKGISSISYSKFLQDAAVVSEEEFKRKTFAIESTKGLTLDTRLGDYFDKGDEVEEGMYRHDKTYYSITGAGGTNKDNKFMETDWRKSNFVNAYKDSMTPVESYSRIYDNRNTYFLNTRDGAFFSLLQSQISNIGELGNVEWKGYKLPLPTYVSDGNAASAVRYEDDYYTTGVGEFLSPLNDLGETASIGTWESDINTTITAETRESTGEYPYPDGGKNFLRITADVGDVDTYARFPIPVVSGEVYNIKFAVRASTYVLSGRIVLEGFSEVLDTPFTNEEWVEYKFDNIKAVITGTAYIYVYPSKNNKYFSSESMKSINWRYSDAIDGHENNRYFTANNTDFSLITELKFNHINEGGYDKRGDGYFSDLSNQISETNDLHIELCRNANTGDFGLYHVDSITEVDLGGGNYYFTLGVTLVNSMSQGSLSYNPDVQYTSYSVYTNPEMGTQTFILSNAIRHGNYRFSINPNGYTPTISDVFDSPSSDSTDSNLELVKAIRENLTPNDPDILISINSRYGRVNVDSTPLRFLTILRTEAETIGVAGHYIDIDGLEIRKDWHENNLYPADNVNNQTPLVEDNTACFINNDGLLEVNDNRNNNFFTIKHYWGMSEIKIIPRNTNYCKRLFLSLQNLNFRNCQVVVVSDGETEFEYTYAVDYRAPKIPTPTNSPVDYILIRHIGLSSRGGSTTTQVKILDIALEQDEQQYSPFLRSVGGTIEQDLAVNGTLSIAGADTNLKNLIPQADTNPTTISELITLLKSTGIIY